jgi:receptor protein-tyrosine kinase
VLLVVSAVHGEGASLVARNLAVRLAEGGNRRVALVDANLRTPSQHEAFGVTRAQGLVEVSRGRMGLDGALHGGSNPGLVLLSAGAPSSSPPGLLAAGQTRQLFAELGARFDWVVVDGPPATVYSDSAILARWSDAALLVVKADGTRREVVKHARRTLDEAGTRVLGAVLNRRHFHIPDWIYRRLS